MGQYTDKGPGDIWPGPYEATPLDEALERIEELEAEVARLLRIIEEET